MTRHLVPLAIGLALPLLAFAACSLNAGPPNPHKTAVLHDASTDGEAPDGETPDAGEEHVP